MYNKIKILVFVLLFSPFAKIIFAQTPVNIETPRGTQVPDTYSTPEFLVEEREYFDDLYASLYPDATQIKLSNEQYSSSNKYNCHGYAWWYVDTGAKLWIGLNSAGAEEVFWTDGSYDEISENTCTKISYTGNHSAVPSGTANYYYSKWGAMPLMYHHKDYSPYNYGTANQFFRRSVDVPLDQPSLTSAVAAAVPGQTINVTSGTYTLSDNLNIPSGVTLSLASRYNVNFNGYYINGAVNVISEPPVYLKNGGSIYYGFYTSITPALNASSSNRDIILTASSFNESLNFTNKSYINLVGSSTTLNGGISVTNSTGVHISGLNMENGPYINSSSGTYFTESNVSGSTLVSDYNGTYSQIGFNTAENISASFGVNSYNGTGDVYGSVISTADCAVFLTQYSNYNVGTSNSFCANGYDIDAQGGSYAYAINNTSYSRVSPSPVHGNVNVIGSIVPCSMLKSIAENPDQAALQSSPLDELNQRYSKMMSDMHKDKQEKKFNPADYTEEHNILISEYKKFLSNKSDRETVKAALSKIAHLYKGKDDKAGLYSFINQTLTEGTLKEYDPYVKRYLLWDYVDKNEFEKSITLADEIISSANITEDLKAEMLYEKGLVYKYYIKDITNAENMFSEIIKKYPGNPMIIFANNELGIKDVSYNSLLQKDENKASAIPLKFESNNFPNPFNPSTTIRYNLPTDGNVTIKIFDIMGREVVSLLNEYKQAGGYNAVWESKDNFGCDVASGIYFYNIKFNNQTLIKKMLLIR